MADPYDEYTRDELIRLLHERDRRPRFGLLWERNEIKHERARAGRFSELRRYTPPRG